MVKRSRAGESKLAAGKALRGLRSVLFAWVVACSSSSEESGGAIGALGGPCTAGGDCDVGLVCTDGICETRAGDDGGTASPCPAAQVPMDCELRRDACDCGPEPSCDSCNGAADYSRCYDACMGSFQRCREDCTDAFETCVDAPPCVTCNTDADCDDPLVCREVLPMNGAAAATNAPDCVEPEVSGTGGTSGGTGGNEANGGSGNEANGGSGNEANGGSGNEANGGSGNEANGGSGNEANGGSGNEGAGSRKN